MENYYSRYKQDSRRRRTASGNSASDPRGGASLDSAWGILWQLMRDFPEARQAVQAGLRDYLAKASNADEEAGDAGRH